MPTTSWLRPVMLWLLNNGLIHSKRTEFFVARYTDRMPRDKIPQHNMPRTKSPLGWICRRSHVLTPKPFSYILLPMCTTCYFRYLIHHANIHLYIWINYTAGELETMPLLFYPRTQYSYHRVTRLKPCLYKYATSTMAPYWPYPIHVVTTVQATEARMPRLKCST